VEEEAVMVVVVMVEGQPLLFSALQRKQKVDEVEGDVKILVH
jgi:hypothetical protein